MSDRIQTGTEHGVEWKIDSSKYDPIIVSVKSLATGEVETREYNCTRKPYSVMMLRIRRMSIRFLTN